MASGILVTDECTEAYLQLSKREFSVLVLKINDEMTKVEVDEKKDFIATDLEASWKEFVESLPEEDCRFVIADFQWKDSPTVVKSKICMILWSPESSPIKSKMIYASSQEAVTNKTPAQRIIQATEYDELSYATVKDSVSK